MEIRTADAWIQRHEAPSGHWRLGFLDPSGHLYHYILARSQIHVPGKALQSDDAEERRSATQTEGIELQRPRIQRGVEDIADFNYLRRRSG